MTSLITYHSSLITCLWLLCEDETLRPADGVEGGEAVVFEDAEVAARVLLDLPGRVRLEAEHDFEQARGRRRADGDEDEVAARREHARQLAQALAQRQVFEHAARQHEVE